MRATKEFGVNGNETILDMTAEVTNLALSICLSRQACVHFRTSDLPQGWSGGVCTPAPYLDLRGPHSSRLFVTAEPDELMQEMRRSQEALLETHFSSISLRGRHGIGGHGINEGRYHKWAAVDSKRPGIHLVFQFQTLQSPEQSEKTFQVIIGRIVFMETSPKR